MPISLRALLLLVVACAVVMTTSGCGVAFMGIGSTIPRYESTSRADVAMGEEIQVKLAARTRQEVIDRWGSPVWVRGRYAGMKEGRLWLETSDGPRSFAPAELSKIEVRHGSEWKTGLIAGTVLDVALVTLLVAEAATYKFELPLGQR